MWSETMASKQHDMVDKSSRLYSFYMQMKASMDRQLKRKTDDESHADIAQPAEVAELDAPDEEVVVEPADPVGVPLAVSSLVTR